MLKEEGKSVYNGDRTEKKQKKKNLGLNQIWILNGIYRKMRRAEDLLDRSTERYHFDNCGTKLKELRLEKGTAQSSGRVGVIGVHR